MMSITTLLGTAVSLSTHPEWAYLGWNKENNIEGEDDSEQELKPNSPTDLSFRKQLPTGCSTPGIPFTVKGSKYNCCLIEPTSATATADADAARRILGFNSIAGVDQLLVRSMGKLSSIVWETPGWWEYELCIGSYLRQYHHEEGIILSEYILGVGNNLLRDRSTCQSTKRYLDQPKKTIYNKLQTAHAKTKLSASGKWTMESNPKVGGGQEPYFVSSYYNGDRCDEMGGIMRETEIRLLCDQNSPSLTFNVTEIRPCKYAASIYLDVICQTREYILVKDYLRDDGEDLTPKQRRERAIIRRKTILESPNIPSVKHILQKNLGSPACILWRDNGWWTYELCVFHWLRQYHESNGVIEAEYFVGRGELANSKKDPIMARPAQYINGKRTMFQQSAINTELEANGTWTAEEEAVCFFFFFKFY